jgi:D-alanyl-lipoteichoic acid acyltransferase DltB (MBOAT superfamily)
MKEAVLPAGSRAMLPEAVKVAWVGLQLGVIIVLARAFHLESPAFYSVVLPLALGGFLVHHWLPRSYQPWFFAALSLAGIGLVFGPAPGAWLVGVGLALIALCHVPVAFRWRVALIVVAAGVLVVMRSAWLPTPWPGVIWPVLGSMFMFRLAIYLYDLKHRGPASPGFVLSYFFLLPNTVFLLFPVIDFQTFRRTHFDKPAFGIYGEGIRWMFRGLTHLVIYRLIYQYVALSPAEVTSTATLVQYLVGNYGLYLRVSGQFHMIVGLLHLFGFRLPETHRFFYLASSFSDLWRRINIYWKDFMQKMVYLPVVFGMKRHGETASLIAATIAVITATWFLHSYQWYWLLGEWLLSATDMAFWGVIGLFLIANTLREQRRGRERQLTAQAPASSHAWRDAVQTAGMFALMAVMWGIWTSPSFGDFRVMLDAATLRTFDVAVVLGTLALVAAAAYISRRFAFGAPSALAVRARWQHPLVVSAIPLALFWAAGESAVAGRMPSIQAIAQQARQIELNKYDAERLQRGYYEQIVGVNRFNGQLWEIYARADENAGTRMAAEATNFADFRDEFGNRAYRPLMQGTFSTNRWGMRDKDYERQRPAGTLRIAILGPSYVVGAGVKDSELFEVLVEDRLNREWSPGQASRIELLNFGLAGVALTEEALMLQTPRVAQFTPNVVILVGHLESQRAIDTFLWKAVRDGRDLPDPVTAVIREAGLTPEMSEIEAKRRLAPHSNTLIREALKDAGQAIQRMGATPIFALIPMPLDPFDSAGKSVILQSAADAGFGVIDMQDLFLGYDPAPLVVGAGNYHPNAEGHRVTAERFYVELMRRADILPPTNDATALKARTDLIAAFDAKRAARVAATVGTRTAAEVIAQQVARQRQIRGMDRSNPWAIQVAMGAVGEVEYLAGGGMRVTITALPEPVGWHVKLRQAPLSFTEGSEYSVKFRARADAPRRMGIGAERHGSPHGLLGFYRSFDVTTEWQTWEWTFTATATEPRGRLFFDLGESQIAAEIADVELRDVETDRLVRPAIRIK